MHTIIVQNKVWEEVKSGLRQLSLKAGGLPMPTYKAKQAEMLNVHLREAGQPEITGIVSGWEPGKSPDTITLRICQ